jgi:small GTP-binding protein
VPREFGHSYYNGASHTVSFKVSILGMPGIGKSAIALRFSKSDFLSYYEATIEEEFEKRVTVQGIDVDISILDTAGQEAFQALRSNWIAGRDGFILGFDATKPTAAAINELFE